MLNRDQITRIIQRVAELPDRSSPDDWPEAMLVTQDELRTIIVEECKEAAAELRESLAGAYCPSD